MTCNTNDLPHVNNSIKSLQEGIRPPDEIVVTLQDDVTDTNLLKLKLKCNVGVHFIRIAKSYGSLSALVGVMERYPIHSNVYVMFLDSNCTYPPHLLQEYQLSLADLNKALKVKLPDIVDSVYGLGGIVMLADKNRNLEKEFQSLIKEKEEEEDKGYEQRTIHGYVRDNATVDYLESFGSILIHRSRLKEDFVDYLTTVWQADLSQDVIFNNYLAKHKILRTQICNLSINRYLLYRGGYLRGHTELPEADKRALYENTAQYLRTKDSFYIY